MKKFIDPQAVGALVERVNFEKSLTMRGKVHDIIPGGTHPYAKGEDQWPERSPGFITRGKGCHV
ncbi:MAG: hypothetical protein ABIP08_10435, partial [Lautropia sp.]